MDKWRESEFITGDEEPLGPLANLVDIVLVFVCGLIAALVALSPDLQKRFESKVQPQDIKLGKELIKVPEQLKDEMQAGEGLESLGKVYKDPKTGKLILISK